jgi:DNA-binding transcriptional regulator YiaG
MTEQDEAWGQIYDEMSGRLKEAMLSRKQPWQRTTTFSRMERLILDVKNLPEDIGDYAKSNNSLPIAPIYNPEMRSLITEVYAQLERDHRLEQLPKYIKSRRLAAGLSAREEANSLGVSIQTIYRWEADGKIPLNQLYKLISLLDPTGTDFIVENVVKLR